LSQLELKARRIIRNEFKINCEEQPRLYGDYYSYKVDGLVDTEGKSIALEYDGPYHHSTVEQKEKDRYKDSKLSFYGYTVLRIPSNIIYNNKSHFKTLLLDAIYGVKHVKHFSKGSVVPGNQAVPLTSTSEPLNSMTHEANHIIERK
jgi:very-short-patch-repair endonuclease